MLCARQDLKNFCTRTYACQSKLSVTLKYAMVCVQFGVMLLQKHRAIIWFEFEAARLNSTWVDWLRIRYASCQTGLEELLYHCLCLPFKGYCLNQMVRGFCLAWRHVVAETQGYHLLCIWGSQIKFQGGGLVQEEMLCARLALKHYCAGPYPYH